MQAVGVAEDNIFKKRKEDDVRESFIGLLPYQPMSLQMSLRFSGLTFILFFYILLFVQSYLHGLSTSNI